MAREFVAEALDRQAFLGVGVQPTPLPAFAGPPEGQSHKSGLIVVELTPGGPAERAGLLPGDILVEFDGVALGRPRDLLRALTTRRPGERVPVGFWRGGQWQRLEAELDQSERRG